MSLRDPLLLLVLGVCACAQGSALASGGSGSGAASQGGSAAGGEGSGAGVDVGGAGEGAQAAGAGGEGGSLPPCDESPCKLVAPQCGCPGGEMCSIDGSGDRGCVEEGSVAMGAACGANGDCLAGGICLGDAEGGYCGEFCEVDGDCAPQICGVKLGDGAGGELPGVTLCSSGCDPASSAGCPAGMGCVLGREGAGAERFFFMCFPAGTATDGALCATADVCAPGYGCYDNGTDTACYRNCDVDNDLCPGAQLCYALNDENAAPVVVDGYSLGVCQ